MAGGSGAASGSSLSASAVHTAAAEKDSSPDARGWPVAKGQPLLSSSRHSGKEGGDGGSHKDNKQGDFKVIEWSSQTESQAKLGKVAGLSWKVKTPGWSLPKSPASRTRARALENWKVPSGCLDTLGSLQGSSSSQTKRVPKFTFRGRKAGKKGRNGSCCRETLYTYLDSLTFQDVLNTDLFGKTKPSLDTLG